MPEKVSRLEGFKATIQALLNQGKRVFVCTDNQDVARQLRAEFSDLVMYQKEFDHQGFSRHILTHYGSPGRWLWLIERVRLSLGIAIPSSWRTTDVADALVEMLLLGRCQRLIGTYYSSFGQVSALIGGIPLSRMEGNTPSDDSFIRHLLQV